MQKIGTQKNIDGFVLNVGNNQNQLNDIIKITKNKMGGYICVANVQMFVMALKDKHFMKIISQAKYVIPDGKPLCWLIKKLFNIDQDRIAGIDIFPVLLKLLQENGLSVMFCGGTKEHMKVLIDKVKNNYNNLKINLPIIPPIIDINHYDFESIISEINDANPDFVFVSLGCPKQEIFMNKISPYVKSTLIGVGAAFPYYIGKFRRSPIWAQERGLEWLFRLINEPRLVRRYLVTNTFFIFYCLKQMINLRGKN